MTDLESHAHILEELAAYIENRLSGERKARVEERLLRDEDYYEIFFHTVRSERQQVEGERAPTPVARWRSWRIAAPLAAAAILALILGLPRPSPTTGDWRRHLDAEAVLTRSAGQLDPGWSRLRSADVADDQMGMDELAFRLGGRSVDLWVATSAGDRRAGQAVVRKLTQLASTSPLLYPLAATYEDLNTRFADAEDDTLKAQVLAAEERLGEIFEHQPSLVHRLTLGQWAEAGRLAVLTRDRDALTRIVRDRPDARSVTEIASAIEALEAAIAQIDTRAEVFRTAESAFGEILSTLAG